MDFRSFYLPYCMERQADGSWIFFNRENSPVGMTQGHLANNLDGTWPVSVHLKGLTGAKLRRLAHDGKIDGRRIYLYDDASSPTTSDANMKRYLARVAILAKLTVVEPARS